ncbi:hypothetical protein AAFF_G00305920 [Aldrovandia affinis]|uniref:Uncharacterized protein n=1 Tax=Aldrovandia affinis TaxID=143900 RepID=A0AAD7WR51_9TELE|nr:hypothetical protein AAFF_G00305920 [Aldrovandia affinis]
MARSALLTQKRQGPWIGPGETGVVYCVAMGEPVAPCTVELIYNLIDLRFSQEESGVLRQNNGSEASFRKSAGDRHPAPLMAHLLSGGRGSGGAGAARGPWQACSNTTGAPGPGLPEVKKISSRSSSSTALREAAEAPALYTLKILPGPLHREPRRCPFLPQRCSFHRPFPPPPRCDISLLPVARGGCRDATTSNNIPRSPRLKNDGRGNGLLDGRHIAHISVAAPARDVKCPDGGVESPLLFCGRFEGPFSGFE